MERRKNLLRKELRRDLFYLFAGWAGKHGQAFDPNNSAAQGGQPHGSQQQGSQQQQQQQQQHSNKSAAASDESGGVSSLTGDFEFSALQVGNPPYTNTNKEKIGSFFSRALAYEVNGFPR